MIYPFVLYTGTNYSFYKEHGLIYSYPINENEAIVGLSQYTTNYRNEIRNQLAQGLIVLISKFKNIGEEIK